MQQLTDAIVEFYTRLATSLPRDVEDKLRQCTEDNSAKRAIETILENVRVAREGKVPICQDTGTPIFYVYYPETMRERDVMAAIVDATRIATAKIPLRPNAVDPLTGKNTGDNVGKDIPLMYFTQWDQDYLFIEGMLKGGGSENVGKTYSLPDSELKAERDLGGVKKCVVDAVFQAQGKGCPPGIVGVCFGGPKDLTEILAKKQLLRKLDDTSPNETLASLEQDLYDKLNSLGIGPAGFGGKSTVLGVKATYAYRNPASFFVTVCYSCWATRRGSMEFKGGEASYDV